MKLQIVNNESEVVNGYMHILIANKEDLKNIVHSSCTEVVAFNVLDKLEYKDALDFFIALLNRVRLNGCITLSSLNLISLGQNIISEEIDSENFSKLIENVKSIIDTRIIINLLESNNFIIDHLILLDRNYYELKATRQK